MFKLWKKKSEAEKHWLSHKIWVWLPDGRKGVIDHLKTDGYFGVRPITDDGKYAQNTSTHWSLLDREKIPEELRLSSKDLRPLRPDEIPRAFR
jgi:hypothetical protein